jgi:hypothetical protein
VKISFAQAVPVPPARAMAAYATPAFFEGRPPKDHIHVIGVVGHSVDEAAHRAVMEVRFAFRGPVSPAVRRVIDHQKMSWITKTTVFLDENRSEWVVLPEHYPDRLTASGRYVFAADGGDPERTVISVEGDLKVHVPLVGGTVERVIVSGLRSYIADEVTSIADLGLTG